MKRKPEYWYNQSAALPYREVDDKIEILLITTRKKKKWIIPKGIIDPGLSGSESAKKEAFEEAGISGDVSKDHIGTYSYKKWGGICTVKIYPLRVDQMFDDWEESFRERKWIHFYQVDEFIKSDSLKKVIKGINELSLIE